MHDNQWSSRKCGRNMLHIHVRCCMLSILAMHVTVMAVVNPAYKTRYQGI